MAVKRLNSHVSEEMHAWLKAESEKRGLTMNAIVIFALETYYNQTIVMPNIPKMMEALEKLEQLEKESK